MPSTSHHRWRTVRAQALDEIAQAHAAVGGTGRGRRYATQQINRAYAMLLAAQFQGFYRDLHSECVDHILGVVAPPPALASLVRAEFIRNRQLDRSNAQPGSLGADFARLGIELWREIKLFDSGAEDWRNDLVLLNEWRNAIAHQEFTSPMLGGIINLPLAVVRQWRASCRHLARSMDVVLHKYLQGLMGSAPW